MECARYKNVVFSVREICSAFFQICLLPFGKERICSFSCGIPQAFFISSSVAFSSPRFKFSSVVPENSTFFCKTAAMFCLRISKSYSLLYAADFHFTFRNVALVRFKEKENRSFKNPCVYFALFYKTKGSRQKLP